MVNVENILRVADAIEKHEIPWLGFNMGEWFSRMSAPDDDCSGNACGTVACIGGWANVLHISTAEKDYRDDWVPPGIWSDDLAGDWLGLSPTEREELFYPADAPDPKVYTLPRAVAVLRHLAATGKVDWSITA